MWGHSKELTLTNQVRHVRGYVGRAGLLNSSTDHQGAAGLEPERCNSQAWLASDTGTAARG